MDYLQKLVDDPTTIFNISQEENNHEGKYFDKLIKKLGDSIVGYSPLDEIFIDDLDASQIFGQTKIVVENVGENVMEKLSELKGDSELEEESSDDGEEEEEEEQEEEEEEQEEQDEPEQEEDEEIDQEIEQDEEEDEEEELDEDGALIDDFIDEPLEEEAEEEQEEEDKPSIKEKNHEAQEANELNDEFFNIDQFNKQILAMEDNGYVEEFVDYNQEISDDEEVDYFEDFFDKPTAKVNDNKKQLMESDDDDIIGDEPEEDEEQYYHQDGREDDLESLDDGEFSNAIGSIKQDFVEKSTFEKNQEKLQNTIKQLEDELVAEKKWAMKGEVNVKQRPEGSLLQDEENFEFERVSKPVPIITEEVTDSIEDIIRKRIEKEEFDDLPKRLLNDIIKPKKVREEVSEVKSSKSLSEIYEDKYHGVEETNEQQEKLNKDHEEILAMINKLNYKLDSLTSFNFVPKPNEIKNIEVKNTTVSMEDSQPEFVSDNNRLAPQEIYKPGKSQDEINLKSGLSYARDELSRDDKQRLRRANKRKKSKQFSNRENKKSKKDSVIDTLTGNKNLTIIGKDGVKTDVKGNVKKQQQINSNNLKL